VTIVGRGPSLLRLTSDDFPRGPVITINLAILEVRKLGLTNPVYTMQKDGCIKHSAQYVPAKRCRCPNPARMVPPIMPETVVLSVAESSRCFRKYPNRIVVDVQKEYGIPWWSMSALLAVRMAKRIGATEIRMLAFDAARGDSRRVEGDKLVPGDRGYAIAVDQINEWSQTINVALQWCDPVSSA
jgi:hypothetical protein